MRSLFKHFVFAAAVVLLGGQPAVAREDAPPTPVEDWSLEKVQVIGAALIARMPLQLSLATHLPNISATVFPRI